MMLTGCHIYINCCRSYKSLFQILWSVFLPTHKKRASAAAAADFHASGNTAIFQEKIRESCYMSSDNTRGQFKEIYFCSIKPLYSA